MESLTSSKTVIEQSASFLFNAGVPKEQHFRLDDSRTGFLSQIDLVKVDDEQNVVLFNPDTHKRDEIVSFRINTPHVHILDSLGAKIDNVQISLIWPNGSRPSSDFVFDNKPGKQVPLGLDFDERYYELLFQVSLPALTFRTFTIRCVQPDAKEQDIFSKTTFLVKNLKQIDREHFQEEIRQRQVNFEDS